MSASADQGPNSPVELPEDLVFAQEELAGIFGNIAEFWGFTRTQGRIFGLVYMSPDPLSQSEIRERLQISTGSASMTINSLLTWGVLHREGRNYIAETNFFALVTHVMRERERGEVDGAIERAKHLVQRLKENTGSDPGVRFALSRAQHVLDFFTAGRALLNAFVTRSPLHRIVDRLARGASRLRSVSFGKTSANKQPLPANSALTAASAEPPVDLDPLPAGKSNDRLDS